MEVMDVAKDQKMKGEDLAHAYDAVRVANKSVCSLLSFSFCFANVLLSRPAKLSCLSPGSWRASCAASAVSRKRGRERGSSRLVTGFLLPSLLMSSAKYVKETQLELSSDYPSELSQLGPKIRPFR